MLRTLEWTVILGLGAALVWVVMAIVIGFTNMLGGMFSRWRAKMAVVYDKFKMEKEWSTPNLPRQAAYRLDLGAYEKSYEGYDKRQADIRVCTLHASEHRCSLAAMEALTSWVRETLVALGERGLDQERVSYVEALLEILASHQETLLSQRKVGSPKYPATKTNDPGSPSNSAEEAVEV